MAMNSHTCLSGASHADMHVSYGRVSQRSTTLRRTSRGHASHRRESQRHMSISQRRASRGHASHRREPQRHVSHRVPLIGVPLLGVPLLGVYSMGVHSMARLS
jgi:hypothetical protein